jgi:DNA-binding XRE family transcriptional regulator
VDQVPDAAATITSSGEVAYASQFVVNGTRARRKKIEGRAAQRLAEETTLQELRQARKLTQVRMAKGLGITQEAVSRLEKRRDLLLSTLRKTVKAMGGNLSLVAEFPDRDPVVLSGIADDDVDVKGVARRHAPA